MDYNQSIEWLYKQLPMFQREGKTAYKANLDNIINFCNHLDNPQTKFKSIHVAGTNGKGSTSHMIASILQEAGYKTGLHTSPHLKDFRERSKINGIMMSEEFVINFIEKNKQFIESLQASFFEVSVAMAFEYFAEKNVDIAVIETGLGGRLDSTNIIHPELSIITNIGLDHTAILGNTFAEIATEKAGIIKNNTPVIIGEYTNETKQVFSEKAKEKNAPIFFAQDLILPDYPTDLKGIYQNINKRNAIIATQVLNDLNWNISDENLKNGLANVVKNTNLRGRWDILQHNPLVIADTAHNPAGINYIIQQIKETPHKTLHLVLGFVNDKDVSSILKMFPENANYYFCSPNVPRKLDVNELKKFIPNNLNAQYFDSVDSALQNAKNNAGKDDLIYVGGSTFVVAEVV